MGLVKHLAKGEAGRQVQIRSYAVGKSPVQKNIIGGDLITCSLNRHLGLSLKFSMIVELAVNVPMQVMYNHHPLHKACQSYLQWTVFSPHNYHH